MKTVRCPNCGRKVCWVEKDKEIGKCGVEVNCTRCGTAVKV